MGVVFSRGAAVIVVAGALAACGLGLRGEGAAGDPPAADAGAGGGAEGGNAGGPVTPAVPDGGTPGERAAYRAAVLADRPLLYYRLEELPPATQVADEVSGGPAGFVKGAPTLGAGGRLGLAERFDGTTNGYVEVDGDATQFSGMAPFTLEAWVLPLAHDGTYRHVFIRDTEDQQENRNEYGVWLLDGKFGFERFSDGTGVKAISDDVTLGAWYHVVAVYDEAALTLWLNGQPVARQADGNVTQTKDKPLLVGSRDPAGGQFEGTIDEVAVYDHALTAARVAAHFQAATE